ncbi:hypothetical protein Pmani_025167 [Petrolisthes manimaculis]|uniref:Uncharacterized protein n=1 Tax=Petrolisthes manimaculis TaxID=1843537 RepID=A0AAE1P8N4_9EUCA|nr:hypothetical protein Pmani_025167 [Petrolisthes manimaculis]
MPGSVVVGTRVGTGVMNRTAIGLSSLSHAPATSRTSEHTSETGQWEGTTESINEGEYLLGGTRPSLVPTTEQSNVKTPSPVLYITLGVQEHHPTTTTVTTPMRTTTTTANNGESSDNNMAEVKEKDESAGGMSQPQSRRKIPAAIDRSWRRTAQFMTRIEEFLRAAREDQTSSLSRHSRALSRSRTRLSEHMSSSGESGSDVESNMDKQGTSRHSPNNGINIPIGQESG